MRLSPAYLVLLLMVCQEVALSQTARPSAAPSGVPFRARVIAVQRGTFPEATLTLEPLGTVALPKGALPKRFQARAYLQRVQGQVRSFTSAVNVRGFLAYYLQPGDIIQGGIAAPAQGQVWVLHGLQRAPSTGPRPRVAPTLRVELSTDDSEYEPGTPVRILLDVTNVGEEAVALGFTTSQRYDFTVQRAGREVWRWSRGQVFATVTGRERIEPGESLQYRAQWDQTDASGQQVPAGTYEVRGWLTTEESRASTESSAEVQIMAPRPQRPSPSRGPKTTRLDDIAANPQAFVNREVTVQGVFQGTDADAREPLLRGGQPVSRRDWVLEDETGGIWVNGDGGLTLDPRRDLGTELQVNGIVRMTPARRVYLRAWTARRAQS